MTNLLITLKSSRKKATNHCTRRLVTRYGPQSVARASDVKKKEKNEPRIWLYANLLRMQGRTFETTVSKFYRAPKFPQNESSTFVVLSFIRTARWLSSIPTDSQVASSSST